MPKIAEVEYTPNPNARKFVLKEPLTWGIARSFDHAGAAEAAVDDGDVLVAQVEQRLHELAGVAR